MKKLFIVLFMVVSLVMVGSAMASGAGHIKDGPGMYKHSVTNRVKYFNDHPGIPSQWVLIVPFDVPVEDQKDASTVTGTYAGQAWDEVESESKTFNDYGYATGAYMIGGEMDTFADAEGYHRKYFFCGPLVPNKAFQEGTILAHSETKAWSWAKDYGLTSKAGAGIKADDGFVVIGGLAIGEDGQREFISSRVIYGADFYQSNLAQEVGYDAGDVVAFNESSLNFMASEQWKTSEGRDIVFHVNGADYTPEVITKGKSEVTIDPTGGYRSIIAHTENMAYIESVPRDMTMHYANVQGNGYVAGQISNGGSFAGGKATFDYTGYTQGSGQADLNATVNTYGNGTTVFVNGSSSAVANGFDGKQLD